MSDQSRKLSSKTPTGGPYDLAGNRLVFTSWYYVRHGNFGWYDDAGNNVSVNGSAASGESHFRSWDMPSGIRLTTQPAQRLRLEVNPNLPWEQKNLRFHCVVRDGDSYRAWGVSEAVGGEKRFCAFYSPDGMDWSHAKPCTFSRPDREALSWTVFRDPSSSPDERYKAVTEAFISQQEFQEYLRERPDDWEPRAIRKDMDQQVLVVLGAVSPDGVNWTALPSPLVAEHSDTQVIATYDRQLGKYVMFTRNYMVGPRSDRAETEDVISWIDFGRRAIGRSESDDFRRFPVSEVIIQPGPDLTPSDLLYTNCKTTIPGAPDHHLMFPSIWHVSNDTTTVVVATSHNAKNWDFVPGPPVLDTAPFGEWDGGCVFASPDLTELLNGDFALPYVGYNVPHKYPRGQFRYWPGYAIWPKGRLVALEAVEKGEFATVAIMPPGQKLTLNVVTKRAGSVSVEVAGLDEQPVPGRTFADSVPIVGDHHKAPVRWKEHDDLGTGGAPLMLRFRLDRASLYGLEFE